MSQNYAGVILRPGREKKIRAAYPWVQHEEVLSAESIESGGLAKLYDSERNFLAVGTFNAQSRFPFRVFSLHDEAIDAAFFERRLTQAIDRRAGIHGTNAKRLVFSEADGLPGLIVDQFADVLVLQVRSLGMELLKDIWLPELIKIVQPEAIYEKSDMEGRREEGLELYQGMLHGNLPSELIIDEGGLSFEVPVIQGNKTGFYLDQRDTRRRLGERVQEGDVVLDTFCYTGGFSLYAGRAGATSIGVDLAPVAIDTAHANARRNGLAHRCHFELANAFDFLAEKPTSRLYDWMVLDPPAIAKQSDKRSSLKWALWKLVHSGIDHLKEGGRMIVCSCSYQLSLQEMQETARLAASDRGKIAFLEEVTLQSPDHPYLLHFPESLYLKCAWIRIETP